ncbi:MAG TPA: O-methyltransferase, partial [candidate division Zixibacteria bacterium]|nr:O-methyltransferase [candidate division Zixibacteria bacterium]
MQSEPWIEVDRYLTALHVPPDPVLESALAASREAGLPSIQVTPLQGQLLQVLALACGARRILEIGTLGGYSTIWLARALPPGGRLVTLEVNSSHAEVARANIARAGLAGTVEIRVGPALASLEAIAARGEGPFDLTFIDADKEGTPEYFRRALDLSRVGGFIVVDNAVRHGKVVERDSDDPRFGGCQFQKAPHAGHPRVKA